MDNPEILRTPGYTRRRKTNKNTIKRWATPTPPKNRVSPVKVLAVIEERKHLRKK
jgi:hypothetical protein